MEKHDATTIRDPEIQDLIDREKIKQCLLRYTRGIDRLDKELILSAFHPDAQDYHCKEHCGSIQHFLDWWLPTQPDREIAQHYLTNITVDIDGDIANAESYFLSPMKNRGQDSLTLVGGRYTDRLEKRKDVWKIALRLVHLEWTVNCDSITLQGLTNLGLGTRDQNDPSYQRPMEIPKAIRDLPTSQ